MGLKTFHLVFISVSVLLAAFTAAWATGQYRLEHEAVYAIYGVGSVLAGAALMVYGAAFQRKARHL